ncbi:type 1 glutamine amidotransferase domain-containing protein [Calidithermus chliarophilus]|uniref:type 1 glutamine amidotransferase domain-containing protein n=1 Tax=Calidithermus chliarophilus TaxID=52023 RepID=UPI00042189D8|nr:type 1 glutamine amidotransferase domain-containing protein [Calidithermus chliarophilus]
MSVIGILLEDYFDEREVIYPYYRVQEAGFEPLVIGPKPGSFHGKTPFTFEAKAAAESVRADDLAGLIVPGGFAPDRMRRHKAMTRLIAEVDARQKPLGAICHAGWALISAGVVKGRRLTGFSSIREDLENAGAVYLDERVVVEGHLVTAQHADDLPAFMQAFLARFD